MAEIQPFRAIRYDKQKAPDLSVLICPPYDIISQVCQQALYARSQYNFVRIEFGETLPQDSETDNRYTRAVSYLRTWQDSGLLTTDGFPAFYVHDQHFIYKGQEYRRRGIGCRVRLEEWARMVVRPHEGTLAAPKGDRIRLLWALGSNTSPILAMYQDDSGDIEAVLGEAVKGKPIAGSLECEGEKHELYAIIQEETINRLVKSFSSLPIYIADGHHRYESALTYQREHHAIYPEAQADAPFNFTLMTLVSIDDPGLLVLPPHRLLRGLPPLKLVELANRLPAFFDIKRFDLGSRSVWQEVDRIRAVPDRLRLIMVGLAKNEAWLLSLRDFDAASRLMPYFHTDLYKKLDVSLVDHIILEEMLGLSPEGEAGIAFNYDLIDAVEMVQRGEYQLAFIIVQPVRPKTIMDIADAQDRMPRKSTYFYPKLPSGLLVNEVAYGD